MPKNLLKKYDVTAIDNDGWMICEPKSDNSVESIEITENLRQIINDVDTLLDYKEQFYIIGIWGEATIEGQIQRADMGDFICRNREDKTDVWIVKRKIFINTYNISD